MNKNILSWENIGYALIIISFILGDLIPTSYELRWTIIIFFFVISIHIKIKKIEKKILGDSK